ncbi:hypothetical protein WG947_02120 [Pontibacter sp. H259]|uniref:hypothetical protein n=1 Tax=Pontibacter sp. H259 TaxID=3133421 RepID=UPI0030BBC8ED
MKNKLLLFIAFLLSSFSVMAQIETLPGKLVLADGQEIEGKIAYYYDNPLIINVYDAANNKKTFEPRDIKEIYLANGQRFVSKVFTTPYETGSRIFQVVVASDKLSLYKREAADLEFYVVKNDEIIRLENNEITFKDTNGKKYKKLDYKYIGTLTTVMQDRADLTDKIQETKFTEKGLAAIVTAYSNGAISYYFASEVETETKPYWLAYAHFTNHASLYRDKTTGPSHGYQIGAQYYFSVKSRNSIRFGLDFSNYDMTELHKDQFGTQRVNVLHSVKSLSLKYQYDFVQSEKIKVYLTAHLLEIGYYTRDYKNDESEDVEKIAMIPRLSPGMGFDVKLHDKISGFFELNHMFQFHALPKNFSVGAKYTFLK